ncbi:B12-binding domain-containing radical SAM protein [Paenibacillus durus]|uniref:Uncharacterized protein n=1 Tax=Paenibacillus durus TaxID=44251 RepID=A0A089HIU1_PAEDU|nr:radical SAM protein [Paenibacillus durus]AIQ11002.1 hypothetical protein PDUR_02490 [Paenibacillus durus]
MDQTVRYKVALVVPLFYETQEFDDMIVEYLGFGYIASYLRKHGIMVEIIDPFVESLRLEDVVIKLIDGCYDLLGFTLMTSDHFNGMKNILNQLPVNMLDHIHILVGGYYATFQRGKLFKEEARINSLVVGEGEITISELVSKLERKQELKDIKGLIYKESGKIITNEKRPFMSAEELDRLPFPARDHIDIIIKKKGRIQVNSSRGCFGQCSFCAVHSFYADQKGKKWRGRSPENVVKEIEDLVTTYNIKYIHFSDEEFIGPGRWGRERAKQIARLLLERNLNIRFSLYCRADSVDEETFQALKKAGLNSVFLGVEFGVQSSLDFYRKGITIPQIKNAITILDRLKIRINVGYMMFEPMINLESFRENLYFCVKYTKFTLKRAISRMAIYPNSDAYVKLLPKIKMDEQLSFDNMYGDYYNYQFVDRRVDFLYKLLNKSLIVISPSKKYLKIKRETMPEDKDNLLANWTYELYRLIDSLAVRLLAETDFSNESLTVYIQAFKEELLAWDSDEKVSCLNKEHLN